MENEIKQKPFIIEIDEAKSEIIQSINNAMQVHKLPCYIVEMILSDVYTQIKNGANSELDALKKQMEAK